MKIKSKLKNVHPGEILLEEFLKPLGISQYELGKESGIPYSSITRIIKCKQSITPETGIKLSTYFGTSEKFWLGLQADYDIDELRRKKAFLFKKNIIRKTNIKSKKLIAL